MLTLDIRGQNDWTYVYILYYKIKHLLHVYCLYNENHFKPNTSCSIYIFDTHINVGRQYSHFKSETKDTTY